MGRIRTCLSEQEGRKDTARETPPPLLGETRGGGCYFVGCAWCWSVDVVFGWAFDWRI